MFQVRVRCSGSRFHVPGSRFVVPAPNPRLGTRTLNTNLDLGTWNVEFVVHKPGPWNMERGTSAPSAVAFIPARVGSKRVPGKNVRVLGGHPMMAYTIGPAL